MQVEIVDSLLGSMPNTWLPNELEPALNATSLWLESQYPLLAPFDHRWEVNGGKSWSVLYNRTPIESYSGVGAAAAFTASPPAHLNVAANAKVYGLNVVETQQALLSMTCGAVLQHRTASFENSDTVLARWLEGFHPDIWAGMQLPPPTPDDQHVSTDHPSELPRLRCQPCGCRPCRRPLPHKVRQAPRQPSMQSS